MDNRRAGDDNWQGRRSNTKSKTTNGKWDGVKNGQNSKERKGRKTTK